MNEDEIKPYHAILKTIIWDTQALISKIASDALASFAQGDELKMMLLGIKRFTRYDAQNVRDARRLIASAIISANKYCY